MDLDPRPARRSALPPLLAALALVGPGGPLHAEGFRSPTIGTAGLGSSGGRIAFIDDASAVAHNPANLTGLQEWEVSVEPTFVHYQAGFVGPAGTASTRDPWQILPHAFIAGPVWGDRVFAGLGLTVPYGLAIDWGDSPAFRYTAPHFTELRTLNVNPTVAFRVCDTLSVAAGVNVMWSELQFRQHYPWALATGIAGLPDGQFGAKGDGVGLGANFAVTWEVVPGHRLAATWRTAMDVDHEGNFGVSGVPLPTGGLGFQSVPFTTEMRFPNIVGLGYGVAIGERLTVEANAEWVEFSRFQSLDINVPLALPGVATSIPQAWKDTFTLGIGGTWRFSERWSGSLSYQRFQSPVPEFTLSPIIPDSGQNAVTVGIRYRHGRHRLQAAYARVFYDDRVVTVNQNPAFLGRYELDVHLISASYALSF